MKMMMMFMMMEMRDIEMRLFLDPISGDRNMRQAKALG